MATAAIPNYKICEDIYARLVSDKEPGLRDRLFDIDSCKKHIFFENKHENGMEYNLMEARHYVRTVVDLTRAKDNFLQNKIEEGTKAFDWALDRDRFVLDLQVYDLVFGKMRELVGASDLEAAKTAFFNPNVNPKFRDEALDHGIKAFQAHWSYGMLRDLEAQIVRGPPEQMYS